MTSLTIEDNIQAINSLNEATLSIANKLSAVIKSLEDILNSTSKIPNDEFSAEIAEEVSSIEEILKQMDGQVPQVDKLLLTFRAKQKIQSLQDKLQEHITDVSVINVLANFQKAILELQELESVLIVAVPIKLFFLKEKLMGDLKWFKDINTSLFYFLQYLENHNVIAIKNSLLLIQIALEKLISTPNIRYYYLNVHESQQKELKKYIDSVISTAKAILWEIERYEKKDRLYAAEDILTKLNNSPKWEWGDDFEECLDFINETRE